MAVVFEFEPAGADETAVTTPYGTVAGDVLYDTAYAFAPLTASARFRNPNGTVATAEQALSAPVTTRYFARVVRLGTFTSGSYTTLLRLRNGATTLAEVRYNSSGQLILRDGSTVRATHAVALNQIIRFELDVTGSTMALRSYTNPNSSVATTASNGLAYTGGAFDRVVDGVGVAAGWTTAHLLYAADGDTDNPSIGDVGGTALPDGVHQFAVIAGTATLLTIETA